MTGERYSPATATDGPAKRYQERVALKAEIELRMESLAHAVHLASQRIELGFPKEQAEDRVVAMAMQFEEYLTGGRDA